jgi:8-oxo-dGTP diphosphatase
MKKKFKAAMVVLLDENKKVLLLKRSQDSNWMPEKWAIPGGHVEEGESPKDAAIRETKEETNLDIDNVYALQEQEQVMMYYSNSSEGTIKLDFEHTDWAWVSFDEMEDYDTTPDLKKIVKMALDNIQ